MTLINLRNLWKKVLRIFAYTSTMEHHGRTTPGVPETDRGRWGDPWWRHAVVPARLAVCAAPLRVLRHSPAQVRVPLAGDGARVRAQGRGQAHR